jgi:hypothetical protein
VLSGAWIPFERALALARQFNCKSLFRPIIDYQTEAKSPPLAPKHVNTPIPGQPPNQKQPVPAMDVVVATPPHPKGTLQRVIQHKELVSDHDVSMRGSDGTGTQSLSEVSSASLTPLPLQDGQSLYNYCVHNDGCDRQALHSL